MIPTSTMSEELLNGESNVFGDLPEQNRRDVATFVKWDSSAATIRMTILAVRTALPYFDKSQPFENRRHLSWS